MISCLFALLTLLAERFSASVLSTSLTVSRSPMLRATGALDQERA